MTSKLIPKNPEEVMVIRQVTPEITTLSLPFKRYGRIKIGGRGTLVRLQDGSVAVFSPVALTPAVRETVASMGEVKYIAAPDMEHHIFLGPWHEAYPSAKIIGPDGLREKREKQNNERVPFHTEFKASTKASVKIDPAFDAEFDYEFVDGHTNKELVFNHRPTKTLIEADLLFNMPAIEQYSKSTEKYDTGFFTKFWTALNNTKGDAKWQKRVIWYGTSAGNRSSFSQSMKKINGWDFDRIIPCHGDVIENNGKHVFQSVMEWHLSKAKAQ
ncbi:uncharacterized protein PV09_06617 [Verruconis gallopava]|uniref:DUF4336 domain-containing protein n=1 Tax=Verruconis gallopava TaxID=253628 RepID=A0A0D2ASI2_9PEZI|nr:uncharacterized protein PV09_06617 [Verruconis gallopava]KIW02129.1 hypothetical protein PV09_06617 [Verruconis gallopava]